MHALRIGVQGIELLTIGRIELPVTDPQRSELRDVRAGRVPLDEVLARLDRVTARLSAVVEDPALRPMSDVDRVDAFVARAYRSAWDAGAFARQCGAATRHSGPPVSTYPRYVAATRHTRSERAAVRHPPGLSARRFRKPPPCPAPGPRAAR